MLLLKRFGINSKINWAMESSDRRVDLKKEGQEGFAVFGVFFLEFFLIPFVMREGTGQQVRHRIKGESR